jgi:hypothetical protein
MPDITMCKGTDCPLKKECYRFLASPSEFWQSYFLDPPYKEGKCTEFWNVKPKKESNNA